MKKIIVIVMFFTYIGGYAQSNILNASSPDDVWKSLSQFNKDSVQDKDKPIPYPLLTDRDIMWSKVTWEIIDLNEKFNFPYYYPIDTTFIEKNRRSLFDVLITAMSTGEIKDIYANGNWTIKLTYRDVLSFLERTDTTELGIEQFNAGLPIDPQYVQKTTIKSRDIQQIRLKGMWFIDKIHGELKYRPLGICLVAPDVNEKFSEDPDLVELFWVWYSSARAPLTRAKVFNDDNASAPLSYDQMINARRFNGLIYSEDNMYGNRKIQDYIKENAIIQLQESMRIKEEIRAKELDMWVY